MEPDDEIQGDPSHALDPVTVFRAANTQSGFEARTVQAILEAEGIATEFVGDARYPSLPSEIRVAQTDAERATALIAEAQALGPDAAAEAEQQTEIP